MQGDIIGIPGGVPAREPFRSSHRKLIERKKIRSAGKGFPLFRIERISITSIGRTIAIRIRNRRVRSSQILLQVGETIHIGIIVIGLPEDSILTLPLVGQAVCVVQVEAKDHLQLAQVCWSVVLCDWSSGVPRVIACPGACPAPFIRKAPRYQVRLCIITCCVEPDVKRFRDRFELTEVDRRVVGCPKGIKFRLGIGNALLRSKAIDEVGDRSARTAIQIGVEVQLRLFRHVLELPRFAGA